jgi:hypothetical protein
LNLLLRRGHREFDGVAEVQARPRQTSPSKSTSEGSVAAKVNRLVVPTRADTAEPRGISSRRQEWCSPRSSTRTRPIQRACIQRQGRWHGDQLASRDAGRSTFPRGTWGKQ